LRHFFQFTFNFGLTACKYIHISHTASRKKDTVYTLVRVFALCRVHALKTLSKNGRPCNVYIQLIKLISYKRSSVQFSLFDPIQTVT